MAFKGETFLSHISTKFRKGVLNYPSSVRPSVCPQSEPGCTTRRGCTPTLAHLQLGCGARCTPHVQLLLGKYGIGHGTPGGTPGNKKVNFSSTPQPQRGVLLVVHPMYSRTRSGSVSVCPSHSVLVQSRSKYNEYLSPAFHSYTLP